MKSNRSLAGSSKIQALNRDHILGLSQDVFPSEVFRPSPQKTGKSRNRVFTEERTLKTMILTANRQDKTLKSSAALYYLLHRQQRAMLLESREREAAAMKQAEAAKGQRGVGRPKKYRVVLRKSLEKDISLNTAVMVKPA